MFALILPPQQNNTSISHSLIKRRALRLIHPIAYFQSSFNRPFYFRRSLPNTNRANRIYASIFKGRAKAITNVSSTDNAEPAQRHPDSLTNEEGQCAPEGGEGWCQLTAVQMFQIRAKESILIGSERLYLKGTVHTVVRTWGCGDVSFIFILGILPF